MGKIRTRFIGDTEIEEEQKKEQKERARKKKQSSKAAHVQEQVEKAAVSAEDEVQEGGLAQKEPQKEAPKKSSSRRKTRHAPGKKYHAAKKKTDSAKLYEIAEAITLLKSISYPSFDESVELHIQIDETGVRGEAALPHPTGKTVRVAIVNDDVLAAIEKGDIAFDVLITHPSYMPKLARFARILGPRGLMPNPKTGTISEDPQAVAKKFSTGVIKWKTEPKAPLIHQMIGKVSHKEDNLAENVISFLQSVGKKRIQKVHIATTMSPSLTLDLSVLV